MTAASTRTRRTVPDTRWLDLPAGAAVSRLRALFDPDTMNAGHGSPDRGGGVVTARGLVRGTPVHAFATEAPDGGTALHPDGCRRILWAVRAACTAGVPVVGLWHPGGPTLPADGAALDAAGRVFHAVASASGRVPQLSVLLGPAQACAAFLPALTDVVVMSGADPLPLAGADLLDPAEVGDGEPAPPTARSRPTRGGVAHVVTADDDAAIDTVRRLAGLLGRPGRVRPATVDTTADGGTDLGAILPARARQAYDVRPLVRGLLDAAGEGAVELHPTVAPNMVTALGRLAGRTVGVLANNPLRKGGCLDSAGAEKAARFVRMCDALGVPLVVLVDVPGYLPGVSEEWNGVVRRGAKLLHAFAEAVVPRVTLVTRKAYGGAYIAMNSRSLGATAVFAWPSAEVAVMDAAAAVRVLHRKQLAACPPEERDALQARLVREHEEKAGGLGRALACGAVDEVVEPARTRHRIAAALAAAIPARGQHANIPL